MSDEKIIKETATRVLGFADRLALPQTILDFCGSLPIYNIEEVPVDGMNDSLLEMEGTNYQTANLLLTIFIFNNCWMRTRKIIT